VAKKKITANSIYAALQAELNGLEAEVGIIDDYQERGATTKTGRTVAGERVLGLKGFSGATGKQRAQELDANYGIISTAFNRMSNEDVIDITEQIGKAISEDSDDADRRRYLNGLQAIVRNPIMRKEYGSNSPVTVKIKGFDWVGVMTGQFFDNIRARFVNV
jgi:hypothetical protein